MFCEIAEYLKAQDVKVEENFKTNNVSYIKAGGVAKLAVEPKTEEELILTVDLLTKTGVNYKIIGNMSNTVLADGIYTGVLIKTDKLANYYAAENKVYAESGARLSRILWSFAKKNLGGLEELILIPASVGGAVYNNAGAHGKVISDSIVSCKVYSTRERCIKVLNVQQMKFGYRYSLLQNTDFILLGATLNFIPKSFDAIKSNISNCITLRRAAQPLEYPSLGSVFKRCNGIGAGYYIEKAGLKGLRIGGAEVSEKHAGFIINRGGATVNDITLLICEIKKRVFSTFGIILEEEIEIIKG